jgi:hypothetical protein
MFRTAGVIAVFADRFGFAEDCELTGKMKKRSATEADNASAAWLLIRWNEMRQRCREQIDAQASRQER